MPIISTIKKGLFKRRFKWKSMIALLLIAVFLLPLLPAEATTAKPQIQTVQLPNGIVGVSYSYSLVATGNLPMDWFIKAGDQLPAGLSLNKDTGVISGTPQRSEQTEFEILAHNFDGMDTRVFQIKVQDPALAPVIATASLPDATEGMLYSTTLTATGKANITWSIAPQSELPQGLSLDEGGMIYGEPTVNGVYHVTVVASNFDGQMQKQLRLKIYAKIPDILTLSLPSGTVSKPYSATLTATGKEGIVWSIMGNVLPEGLTLNPQTGTISGTPTKGGAFHFLVGASNQEGQDSVSLSIMIASPPEITSRVLADGKAGIEYSRTLTASGDGPMIWSITAGKLPDGLTLHASSGLISGMPTKAGTFEFAVTVMNNDGMDSREFYITIYGSTPIIATDTLPDAEAGSFYSAAVSATGSAPITWSFTGALPEGLTLNSVSGVISGMPVTPGVYAFVLRATNSVGYSSQPISITVLPQKPLITTKTAPNAIVGNLYQTTLQAKGTGPITWSVIEGQLPDGLVLHPTHGTISGRPSSIGNSTFTIEARNVAGSDKATFSIQSISQFTDISGHWAYEDILWVYARGLFKGYTQTTFLPQGKMTRAMFVTALWRYAGEPIGLGGKTFSDVPPGSYYQKAVAWASGDGIVNGTSETTFSPNQNISREDLVVQLFRYSIAAGLDTSQRTNLSIFTDKNRIGFWAEDAISWAVKCDILRGNSPTTINPKGTATRAEAAAMFKRYIEKYAN